MVIILREGSSSLTSALMPFLSALIGGLLALAGVFATQWWTGRRERQAWGRTESATAHKEFLKEYQRLWAIADADRVYGSIPWGEYEEEKLEPLRALHHTLAMFSHGRTLHRAGMAVEALNRYLLNDGQGNRDLAERAREKYLDAVREEFGIM